MPSGKKVSPLFGIFLVSLSAILIAWDSNALAARSGPKPYVVVLDPGHGGTDTGAIGKQGKKRVAEKDIALAIAIRTRRILEDPAYSKALGRPIKVLLTRAKDEYISLEDRSEKARNLKADLFVSIHANAESSRLMSFVTSACTRARSRSASA